MSVKQSELRNFEVEQLSIILSGDRFKFTNLDNHTRIKIVRIQIMLDPIFEKIDKARRTAEAKFATERLVELNDRKKGNALTDEEEIEFKQLSGEFRNGMEESLSPLMNESVKVNLDKLSIAQYQQLLDANADWMTGVIPKFIFLHLVNENID